MKNNIHTKFILTPISEILSDCVNAVKGASYGIESQPLCEYIMQTTFLKMTGASEQKLKCIVWELATFDFEFRYEFLKNAKSYREYSSFDQKNKVFKDLKDEILKFSAQEVLQSVFEDSKKTEILRKITDMTNLFEKSCIAKWQEKEFLFFKKNINAFIKKTSFCNYNTRESSLNFYEQTDNYKKIVFDHRNRCAHNLKSYQANSPKFSSLIDENYDYENYFFRFAILILFDEIFMQMYQTYLGLLRNSAWYEK